MTASVTIVNTSNHDHVLAVTRGVVTDRIRRGEQVRHGYSGQPISISIVDEGVPDAKGDASDYMGEMDVHTYDRSREAP